VEESGKVVIRSFRLVFDLGYRRLFKIDRYRLPFAYGLPILGILYAALVALALVLAAKLPVAGPALAALPPPIHWVAIPVGLSMVMLHWRPDGLKPHAALWARRRLRRGICRAGSPPSATATARISARSPARPTGARRATGPASRAARRPGST
jgi:hypothetical protein